MAKKSRQTFLKRQKEKARMERKMEKMARRMEAKARKAEASHEVESSGEDPDIAGIVPGPQPLPPQFSELIEWDQRAKRSKSEASEKSD